MHMNTHYYISYGIDTLLGLKIFAQLLTYPKDPKENIIRLEFRKTQSQDRRHERTQR